MATQLTPPQLEPVELPGPATRTLALGTSQNPKTPIGSSVTGGLIPPIPTPEAQPAPPTGGLSPLPGPGQPAATAAASTGGLVPPVPVAAAAPAPVAAPVAAPAAAPAAAAPVVHPLTQAGMPNNVAQNPGLQGKNPERVARLVQMQQTDLANAQAALQNPHPLDTAPQKDPAGFKKWFNRAKKQGLDDTAAAAAANAETLDFYPGNASYLGTLQERYANGGSAEYLAQVANGGFFGDDPAVAPTPEPPPFVPPVVPTPEAPPEVGREILGEGGPAFPQFDLDTSVSDPFSDIINQKLADLGQGIGATPGLGEGLGAAGDQGVQTLADLTQTGGTNPEILKAARRNLEEQLVGARKAGSNDLLNSLAGRGLSGGGTAVQGLTNLEEGLRSEQGQRLRDLSIAEQLAAQDRSLNAASTLGQQDLQKQQLNLTAEQQGIQNSLQSLSEATGRALGIGDLGLKNMAENLDFIEAMRKLNLDEASFIEATNQARQGNVNNALGMLLNLFNMLQQGFV